MGELIGHEQQQMGLGHIVQRTEFGLCRLHLPAVAESTLTRHDGDRRKESIATIVLDLRLVEKFSHRPSSLSFHRHQRRVA